jgi:hypothetical protein
MLNTGFISFITETGGGFDSNNNPIAPVSVLSDYIQCNLSVAKSNYQIVVNGEALLASYIMYIEHNDLPDDFDLSLVHDIQLQDADGTALGKYRVQYKGNCNFVKRLKIVV